VKNLPGVAVRAEPAVAPVKTEGATHFRFEGAATVGVRLKQVGAVALTGTRGDQPYFAASVAPALRTVAAAGQDRAVFLLDTSLSSNPDRFNVWLKLLRALLEKNQGTIKQFAVAFFNAGVTWHERGWAENSPASVEALLRRCEGLALEGATDLGAALAAGAQPAWHQGSERFDLFLLSDGASTWGEGDAHALSRLVRSSPRAGSLFAYTTGLAGTDTAMLDHLARETGGAVFALASEQEVAATAVAHNQRPWRLKDVQVEGGSDLLLAGRPGVIFGGQRLQLVGRGAPKAGSRVAFTVEMNGQSEQVVVPIEQVVPSVAASRLYGQVAVGQMEELLPANAEAARGYASHFRVTGQSASLLMLETEAEYERLTLSPAADAAAVAGRPAGALV
ncbi:MAG: VWA domain-containing protein, partial [Myxococcales bacterium]